MFTLASKMIKTDEKKMVRQEIAKIFVYVIKRSIIYQLITISSHLSSKKHLKNETKHDCALCQKLKELKIEVNLPCLKLNMYNFYPKQKVRKGKHFKQLKIQKIFGVIECFLNNIFNVNRANVKVLI